MRLSPIIKDKKVTQTKSNLNSLKLPKKKEKICH